MYQLQKPPKIYLHLYSKQSRNNPTKDDKESIAAGKVVRGSKKKNEL